MACSGVHREFNHRVKGIGHSTFTAEDVAKLQHSESGNEAVNAKFLARYDPRRDRMKAPCNNTDLQHLRTWIKKKYIDKSYCAGEDAAAANTTASRSSVSSKSSSSSRRKVTKSTTTPTAAAPTPAADPFGFDSIAPSSASARDTSWDAFGGTTTQQAVAPVPPPAATATTTTFQADFGNMNGNSSAAPSSAAPMPAFQADFGAMNHQPPAAAPAAATATAFQADFGNNFSQPTMVSMPPAVPQGQPQQQQQQPPMPQQQQQPSGQGGFGQFPVGNQQQQSFQADFNQASMMQQQQPTHQTSFQANFDQGPPQQVTQQQQPTTQHTSFQANFDQVPTQQVTQQQQPSAFQANFNQVSQNNTVVANTTQQQPQQSFQANNFSQPMGGMAQQQPPQMENAQVQQTGGDMMMNQQTPGMGFGQFPQNQQQTQQQMVNNIQQQAGLNGMQQTSQVSQQQASMSVQSNGSANVSQTAAGAATVQPEDKPKESPQQELQSEHVNPNAFNTTDTKKDAFDAFDGLSLEPTDSKGQIKPPVSEVDDSTPSQKQKDLQFTKYNEGQQVVYTNGEGSYMATIKKVHYDDELQPYYTIALNGREKQTDDAHLSLPNEMVQNQNVQSSQPRDVNTKLEETIAMLKSLGESQLLEVQQFIARLLQTPAAQPTPIQPAMEMAQQEQNKSSYSHQYHHHHHHQQQQQQQTQMTGGMMPYQQNSGMGGVPMQNQNQNFAAQQSIAMQPSSQPSGQYNSATPTQMASMQQPGQQMSTMDMGGMQHQMQATVNQATVQQQQQQPMPTQMPMQQIPMQQSPQVMAQMGLGLQQPTTNTPNPGSSSAQMGVMPQQYAPSPTTAPMVPPSSNVPPTLPPQTMPPVEKEGNPFDMY
jgi:hypothetical protein